MTRLYDATIGQFDQFKRLLADQGNLTAEELEEILRQPELVNVMVAALREQLTPPAATVGLDKFSPYLLSLDQQIHCLRLYDVNFWHGEVEKAGWFEYLIGETNHVQMVNDLEIYYVDFGSPEQNIEMWWKVLTGTQPYAWRWDRLKTDSKHLRLHNEAFQYQPGIHRVHINLVANWEPQTGRSVEGVRERNSHNQYLAHAEVLAAYGLHPELLQKMDGEDLPYADMAGYEASVPRHQPWTGCPDLSWSGINRKVSLNAYWVGYVDYDWAAPVVRES